VLDGAQGGCYVDEELVPLRRRAQHLDDHNTGIVPSHASMIAPSLVPRQTIAGSTTEAHSASQVGRRERGRRS